MVQGLKLALPTVALMLNGATVTAQMVGPEVGTRSPAFELRDQSGELRTFEDIAGENGLLLLFFRSADW